MYKKKKKTENNEEHIEYVGEDSYSSRSCYI